MRFAHLAEHIFHRAWFITPEAHSAIAALYQRAMASDFDRKALDLGDLFPQRQPLEIGDDGIAKIHVMGPLGKGLSKMEQTCGATGFEQIRADYSNAMNGGAKGILLHVDSPGGTVMGTPEVAAMVASQPVPTVAYTEDVMASAAYYVASGANRIISSPSAEVGSIGVYIPWMDRSAQYAAAGIKPDPIVNTGGDLKAIGFGGKLSDEQRAHLQAGVDADFAAFKAHVLSQRAIPDSAMRGQVMHGDAAVAANLVDELGDMEHARAVLRGLIR